MCSSPPPPLVDATCAAGALSGAGAGAVGVLVAKLSMLKFFFRTSSMRLVLRHRAFFAAPFVFFFGCGRNRWVGWAGNDTKRV